MTAHEYLVERSAIAEYDGGLSREAADDQAAAGLQGVPEFTRQERIDGLARYIADMPDNERRKGFLERFAKRHGAEIAGVVRQAAWDEIRRRASNG